MKGILLVLSGLFPQMLLYVPAYILLCSISRQLYECTSEHRTDISVKELQNRCDSVYITLNKNTVPNDPRSPFVTSGVRIGTPAVTSRGLVESDMERIAHLVWLTATDYENKADEIRAAVTEICSAHPIYE